MAPVKKPAPQKVGWRTDTMVKAGLVNDFDGEITEARYVRWDYDGKLDHDILAVRLTIQPDDPDVNKGEPVVQHYSAGDIKNWVPSEDGEEEADEGVYVAKGENGKQTGLPDSSNFAQFVGALEALGFNSDDPALSAMEGVRGHWYRVAQRKRAGMAASATGGEGGGDERQRTILVLTELAKGAAKKSAGATAAKGKPPAAKKAAPKDEEESGEDENDLESQVAASIAEKVGEEGTLTVKEITSHIVKAFKGPNMKPALKLAQDTEWLAGRDEFAWDEDEETVTAA